MSERLHTGTYDMSVRVTAYPCSPNMPRRNEENVVDKMGTFFFIVGYSKQFNMIGDDLHIKTLIHCSIVV